LRPTAARKPSRLALGAVYLLVCLIWGTTWFAMKVAVETVPPITSAGIRFAAAFPFLAVAIALSPAASFRAPGKRWLLVFVAVAYVAAPYALINYGELHVGSGLASLLFASVSVFLLLFSRVVSGTRVGAAQRGGLALGLCLLGCLMAVAGRDLSAAGPGPACAILVAASLHGLTYAVLGRWGKDVGALTAEAVPMGIGGGVLLVVGVALERPDFSQVSAASWLALAYLAVVASVIGIGAYFYLLKHLDAVTVSYMFVLFPVVAMVVASVLEGERFSAAAWAIAAAMLAAFGATKARAGHGMRKRRGRPADLFSRGVMARLREAALDAYPEEACGFVVAGRVRRAASLAGGVSAAVPSGFERPATAGHGMGLDDVLFLEESLGTDRPVKAVYRTHPNGEAYFSEEDERWAAIDGAAAYPGVFQLVLGVDGGGVRQARVFLFDGQRHTEVLDLSRHPAASALFD
jgi:drug/metabolite transporter (DMT)-like permease/proteasome lid subunit RPN8/RPN11